MQRWSVFTAFADIWSVLRAFIDIWQGGTKGSPGPHAVYIAQLLGCVCTHQFHLSQWHLGTPWPFSAHQEERASETPERPATVCATRYVKYFDIEQWSCCETALLLVPKDSATGHVCVCKRSLHVLDGPHLRVVANSQHLTVKSDRLLTQSLRVADIAHHQIGERKLFALLEFLANLSSSDNYVSTHSILCLHDVRTYCLASELRARNTVGLRHGWFAWLGS